MFNDSRFRNTGRSEVYPTVPDYSEAVSEGETVRDWYEKQADCGKIERWSVEKMIAFVALAIIAFVAAYKAADVAAVVICSVLFLSFGIITDPLHLTRRKVSKKSRLLFGLALLPFLMLVAMPGVRTVIVTAIISIVLVTIARRGNRHWRASESYEMSKHVLKALQQHKRGEATGDTKDACSVAWKADGAREVVAVAAEMGAYQCSDIEWFVRKAAYTIGFSRASSISKKLISEAQRNAQEAEGAKQEAKELKARLEAVEDYAKKYDSYTAKLDEAEKTAKENARAISDLINARDEIRKLKATVERLEAANKELVQTADNPLLAAEVAEAETERRLKEAAEKGLSVRQTEAFAGVSHRRAAEYLKAHRKSA